MSFDKMSFDKISLYYRYYNTELLETAK